jgi:hypothetical protein
MPFPDFSPGEVLTAADMDSIGLWLVKTQTIGTAVSSVTVTDAFSADYENYKIIITGGAGSLVATLNMTLGATVTGYYFGATAFSYATATSTPINGNNVASFIRTGIMAANGLNGEIELFSPNLPRRTSCNARYVQLVTAGNTVISGGFLDNNTQYTDFTLTTSSGTMTGGTVRVYGYRN